ncbi:hypothetical protein GGI02_001169 [Coemansia sp. RSA 2322]|nr:hypothetical protein GGI02_001169 [Coemansia sp. RSA 2322]
MLPQAGQPNNTPPPPPPSSASGEDAGHTTSCADSYDPPPHSFFTPHHSNLLDGLFAGGPLDISALSDLLGSLDGAPALSASAVRDEHAACAAPGDIAGSGSQSEPGDDGDYRDVSMAADNVMDYDGITTEAVLFGLRSLDEFERQAAIHTEGRLTQDDYDDSDDDRDYDASDLALHTAATDAGDQFYGHVGNLDLLHAHSEHAHNPASTLGSFNEAELSAALEQIYWSSLEMPLPESSTLGSMGSATEPGSSLSIAAPTPATTPMPQALPPHTGPCAAEFASWPPSASAADGGNGYGAGAEEMMAYANSGNDESDGGEYDSADDDDNENPLELEELSLFSLFLSDMSAFESFLSNLSLNQLRQCAATVNSVLVRRESAHDNVANPTQAAGRPRNAGDSPLRPLHAGHARTKTTGASTDTSYSAALKEPLLAGNDAGDGVQENSSLAGSYQDVHASDHDTAGFAQATDPLIETGSDDVPWLSFVYAQKGKPKRHRIRIDIERAPLPAIPHSFKANNCVYPRANCSKPTYAGNRWSYETECNGIGWKLAFLNQELLSGRRGLLQTAVNNYRTMVAGRKSRRIARLEKAERTHHGRSGANDHRHAAITSTRGVPSASGYKRPLPAPISVNMPDLRESSNAAARLASAPSEKRAKLDHCATVAGADFGHNAVSPPPPTAGEGEHSQLSFATAASIGLNEKPTGAQTKSSTAKVPASTPARVPGQPPAAAAAAASQHAKCLNINAFINSKVSRIRISVDLGAVDSEGADARFKREHAVFPRALNAPRSRYGALQGRWEFELACNELAWKLAWLNKSRLKGRKPLIQKCLDAYRGKFAAPPWSLLSCHAEEMNGSVDPRFFDYWTPRLGRRGLASILPLQESQPLRPSQAPSQSGLARQHLSLVMPLPTSSQPSNSPDRSTGATQSLGSGAPSRQAPTKPPSSGLARERSSDHIPVDQTSDLDMSAPSTEVPAANKEPATKGLSRLTSGLSDTETRTASGELSQLPSSTSGFDSAARMLIVRPKSGATGKPAPPQPGPSAPTPSYPMSASCPSTALQRAASVTRQGVPPKPAVFAVISASAPQPSCVNPPAPAVLPRQCVSSNPVSTGVDEVDSRNQPAPPALALQPPAATPACRLPAMPARPAILTSPSSRPPLRPQPDMLGNQNAAVKVNINAGQVALRPAPGQHARPGQKQLATLVVSSTKSVPSRPAQDPHTPDPGRTSAHMQQKQLQQPATASSGCSSGGMPLTPGSVASPPVYSRRHTDVTGTATTSLTTRPVALKASTSRPCIALPGSRKTPPAEFRDGVGVVNPSLPVHAWAADKPGAKALALSCKANASSVSKGHNRMAPPLPTAVPGRGGGSEKSAKAQVAANMITDVLRRLAKTDPSLAPLAGVLGSSKQGGSKSQASVSSCGSGGQGDEDDDAPLDAKVAELEKLIIDIQNN